MSSLETKVAKYFESNRQFSAIPQVDAKIILNEVLFL